MKRPNTIWRMAAVAMALIGLGAVGPASAPAQTGDSGQAEGAVPDQEANAAFDALFKSAEKRLMNAGPRLNQVRGEVIGELVEFADEYRGSVAAAVAMRNAGNLAEVLGEFDRAEKLYRQGLEHRPPRQVYSGIANSVAHVIARPGRQIRDFTATTLDGDTVSPESLEGQVYLLDFWATWCGPCIEELPHLRRAYKVWKDQGFEVVSISLDSDKEELTDFIEKNDMTWTHVYDEDRPADNRLGDVFGVYGIPHTILVGQDGTIIGGGYRGHELDEALEKALGG